MLDDMSLALSIKVWLSTAYNLTSQVISPPTWGFYKPVSVLALRGVNPYGFKGSGKLESATGLGSPCPLGGSPLKNPAVAWELGRLHSLRVRLSYGPTVTTMSQGLV